MGKDLFRACARHLLYTALAVLCCLAMVGVMAWGIECHNQSTERR